MRFNIFILDLLIAQDISTRLLLLIAWIWGFLRFLGFLFIVFYYLCYFLLSYFKSWSIAWHLAMLRFILLSRETISWLILRILILHFEVLSNFFLKLWQNIINVSLIHDKFLLLHLFLVFRWALYMMFVHVFYFDWLLFLLLIAWPLDVVLLTFLYQ